MKVLFYEPFAINIPHFERCLELLQRHLDEGDEVVFLGCNADLPACSVNWTHNAFICRTCIHRQRKGLELISPKINSKSFLFLTGENKEVINRKRKLTFRHVDELKKERYENFDFGYATASSLISATRNANPDMEKYEEYTRKIIDASLKVYFSIINHIRNEAADRIYLFNGRFAVLRAAMRAAEAEQVDFYIHEVGASIDKFCLYKNAMPHNIKYRTAQIIEFWEKANPENRAKTGAAFYEDQMKGRVADARYFHTRNQKQGLLPENWDPSKINICIFNSSEDEFSAIGDEWKLPFYTSQKDGIRRLVDSLSKYPEEVNVYLRIHPNMANMKGDTVSELDRIKAPNFMVIAPDSPISTYEMVRSCDKTITFLSSVGIEAAFHGKPVILLGNNFYRALGSTYNPESHEAAIKMILDKHLPPKDKTGALMYGYYRKKWGIPYKYYQPESLFKGKFKSQVVETPWLLNAIGMVFKKVQKLTVGLK